MTIEKILVEADRVFLDYLRKMYGVAPNRLLMNAKLAERFKQEISAQSFHGEKLPSDIQQIYYRGMRLVEDHNALGVEVAFAR